MNIGNKVKVVKSITSSKAYIGREGILTSVDERAKLSHHVTLTGETYETDFSKKELEVV